MLTLLPLSVNVAELFWSLLCSPGGSVVGELKHVGERQKPSAHRDRSDAGDYGSLHEREANIGTNAWHTSEEAG